jgi:hypothetical protein
MAGIENHLRNWYKENYPAIDQAKLDRSIAGAQNAYAMNVFPEMNLEWGTYVNHIGHGEAFDIGCFRCHDGMHESEAGEVISSDCTTCHVILAEDEKNPEILQTLQGE